MVATILLAALVTPGTASATGTGTTVSGASAFRLTVTWELGRWVTWQPGTGQTGYRVLRTSDTPPTLTSETLSATATGLFDLNPPDRNNGCYQLDTLSGSTVVARSADLCVEGGGTDTILNPLAISIGLDDVGRPVMQWVPNPAAADVGGVKEYVVEQTGAPSQLLPGGSTEATGAPITAATCLKQIEDGVIGPGAGYSPGFCVFPNPALP